MFLTKAHLFKTGSDAIRISCIGAKCLLKVEILIKRVPLGKVFLLKKSTADQEDLGIIHKNGKNEVVSVVDGGIAANSGLPPRSASFFNPETETNWFITEVNGRPVNLFAKDNEREMHVCAAHCCEDKQLSMESVDRCVKNCSKRGQAAQEYIQEEMKNFQERINRCALDCRDQVRDMMETSKSEHVSADLQQKADNCLMKCVDDHIRLIPGLKKRVTDFLISNR
ncbi:unnamed protein product [Soboliphyme baturini]|uniref:Protein FAM136A n=1 Tax=Soboliphyme baturini TaxID=241478 RepID=A0A183IX65_9BILA|nr:unnamed protein product [Soboliphyme baturini]